MSDSETEKPKLGRKPLGLKRTVEAGQVQQSFSHGRKNTVVVEVKRRRLIGKPGEQAEAPPPPAAEPAKPAPAVAPRPAQIGRAHVCTPVTNAHLVCRLLLEKKKQ